MRPWTLCLIAGALTASPALAQDNATDPAMAGPEAEAAMNGLTADPAMTDPALADPALTDPALTDPAQPVATPTMADPALTDATITDEDDGGGFPWGILGLLGLVGLIGRFRS